MSHQFQTLGSPVGHARVRTITIQVTSAQPDELVSGWGKSLVDTALTCWEDLVCPGC